MQLTRATSQYETQVGDRYRSLRGGLKGWIFLFQSFRTPVRIVFGGRGNTGGSDQGRGQGDEGRYMMLEPVTVDGPR